MNVFLQFCLNLSYPLLKKYANGALKLSPQLSKYLLPGSLK